MTGIETADRCPKCEAATYFRLSVEGTRLRLDAEPNPNGTVIILDLDGKVRAKCLTGSELPAQQEAWTMHVCARRDGRPDPNCVVCRRPMPRDIAERLGWTDHPGCDREYKAEVVRVALETKRAARELRRAS
jgi:hypothetical protein